MSNISYYTEQGLKKLKDELNQLKDVERPKASNAIAEARDKGDLSENAEYDAAKDAQGHLEHRIKQLESIVGDARVLDINAIDTSKVGILSFVRIKNLKTNAEVKYQLVAEEEANLAFGKISVKSPIGKGLLGKKKGDLAVMNVPAGEVKFKILEISYA